MLPRVRAVLVMTLGLALWYIADGVRCLVAGTYFGQILSPDIAAATPYALALPDGRFISYGPWAAYLVELGLDPHRLAPFFVGLGVAGLAGLVLFLQARPVGWALLVAFALLAAAKVGAITVLAGALLVVLMLPGTRRLLD